MYKLCGGTLLVLLLNSSKRNKESSLLSDMLKVLIPTCFIDKSTLKEQTKKFKVCIEHSCLATPFEDSSVQKKITEDIHERYDELLQRIIRFIDTNIYTDSDLHKDVLLVKAIIEVIEQDDSIPENQSLYILPNGKPVTKAKLISMNRIYLPSFLLGVLYYVMMNINDNKEGSNTYEEWCPKDAQKAHTQRKYTANIGENSKKVIQLIKSPKDYSKSELLSLTGELSILYVKKAPTEEVDATGICIDFSETINNDDIDQYYKFELNPQDYDKALMFFNDYNNLIDSVNKYNDSTDFDKLKILNKAKQCFINKWLRDVNFDDQQADSLYKLLILKVESNKKIDIYTIKQYVKHMRLSTNSLSQYSTSAKYKMPQFSILPSTGNKKEQKESVTIETKENTDTQK